MLGLTLKTYGGNNINDGTFYESFALAPSAANSFSASPVLSNIPGKWAMYNYTQPQPLELEIEIHLLNLTQPYFTQIQNWFNPTIGEQWLVALMSDATTYIRIACSVVSFDSTAANIYKVKLSCAKGVWESTIPTTVSQTVSGSTALVTLTNNGNYPARPTFVLTPTVAKSAALDFTRRQRVALANRSDRPLYDPVGEGYPIDLGQDAFDTAARVSASQMQADGDDLRVWQAGGEINRWLDGINTTTTKVWSHFNSATKRTITLPAAWSSATSPSVGTLITTVANESLLGWLRDDFLIVDSEAVQIEVIDSSRFIVVKRGALGTTAASHSAAIVAYRIEHPWLDIFYGNSGVATPAPPDDFKPIIDLALSTNLLHVWNDPFLNSNTRRSRGWVATWTDDGPVADKIGLTDSLAGIRFYDRVPGEDAPKFNNISMDFPVPLDSAAGSLELDITVDLVLLLHLYVTDSQGYETLLATQGPTAVLTNQEFAPGNSIYGVRLNARHGGLLGVWYEQDPPDSGIPRGELRPNVIEGNETDYYAMSFVIDEDETDITGIAIVASKQNGSPEDLQLWLYTDDGGLPGRALNPQPLVFENASILDSDNTWIYRPFIPDNPTTIKLSAGRHHVVFRQSAVNVGDDLLVIITFSGQIRSRIYSVKNTVIEGNVPACILMTKLTDAQIDAPIETGLKITLDNIEMALATASAPKINMGANETMYLCRTKIRNLQNNKYIELAHPIAFGVGLLIDCEAQRLIDGESGLDIPFAIVSSDVDEWPSLEPGSNIIEITEEYNGVSVMGSMVFVAEHHNAWL